MHTKLDDIYTWFKQNLEERRAATAPRSPQHQPSVQDQHHGRLYFSVAIHIMPGREHKKLHCPRATFRDDWLDEDDPFRIAPSIFQCCCSKNWGAEDHVEALHVSCKCPLLLSNPKKVYLHLVKCYRQACWFKLQPKTMSPNAGICTPRRVLCPTGLVRSTSQKLNPQVLPPINLIPEQLTDSYKQSFRTSKPQPRGSRSCRPTSISCAGKAQVSFPSTQMQDLRHRTAECLF